MDAHVRFISEAQSRMALTRPLALASARDAMIAAAQNDPKVAATILHGASPANRISIKPAIINGRTGIKIGTYWPNNLDLGLTRHGSFIILFDEATGRVDTVVQASEANALRTAAADALAVDVLARADARILTIFGAGHQAFHEVMAIGDVRRLDRVHVVSSNPAKSSALVARLCAAGLYAKADEAEAACRSADIIVTVTPARAALFEAEWVNPGTHISAMGADGPGKQELPTRLLGRARLFCDRPTQSVMLGEFQTVARQVGAGTIELASLGDVLSGARQGRRDPTDITIFDSSGIGEQDVSIALRLTAMPDCEG